jgi:prevent-host-death family protein
MGDHITKPARRAGAQQRVGVRELKTHAARILRQVRERRASYLLTHRGRTIGVILPFDSQDETPDALDADAATAAWEAFLRAGRKLERRFATGQSGVRLLSDMRR